MLRSRALRPSPAEMEKVAHVMPRNLFRSVEGAMWAVGTRCWGDHRGVQSSSDTCHVDISATSAQGPRPVRAFDAALLRDATPSGAGGGGGGGVGPGGGGGRPGLVAPSRLFRSPPPPGAS